MVIRACFTSIIIIYIHGYTERSIGSLVTTPTRATPAHMHVPHKTLSDRGRKKFETTIAYKNTPCVYVTPLLKILATGLLPYYCSTDYHKEDIDNERSLEPVSLKCPFTADSRIRSMWLWLHGWWLAQQLMMALALKRAPNSWEWDRAIMGAQ